MDTTTEGTYSLDVDNQTPPIFIMKEEQFCNFENDHRVLAFLPHWKTLPGANAAHLNAISQSKLNKKGAWLCNVLRKTDPEESDTEVSMVMDTQESPLLKVSRSNSSTTSRSSVLPTTLQFGTAAITPTIAPFTGPLTEGTEQLFVIL
jgi:hypothetical protein